MGQYYKGQKIGTCEAMYYLRLNQAKKLAKEGQSDDDGISFKEYLNDDATMFRFPYPEEDGLSQVELLNDDTPTFKLPAGCLDEVNHREKCYSNELKDGGHNVNIFLPCIYSEEFKKMGIKTSHNGAGEQFLNIEFQTIRDGKEKTIFSCSRCGQLQRFTDEDIEKLKKRAIEYYEVYNEKGKNPTYNGNQKLYDRAMKIIDRIK